MIGGEAPPRAKGRKKGYLHRLLVGGGSSGVREEKGRERLREGECRSGGSGQERGGGNWEKEIGKRWDG